MPQLGPLEIAVVLLIALLVFGPNRLPELARQVGGMMRELKKIQHNIRQDLNQMMADVSDASDGAAPPPTLPPKDTLTTAPAAGDVIDVTGGEASPAPATDPAPRTDPAPAAPETAPPPPAPAPDAD